MSFCSFCRTLSSLDGCSKLRPSGNLLSYPHSYAVDLNHRWRNSTKEMRKSPHSGINELALSLFLASLIKVTTS